MANRLESIWDAIRNSMNPEEEQASPIGNSYSQGHGYNYPVPNEWGNSNQTTSEPTSLLSQIPESARQSIDLGRPPIVNNDMLPTKGSMDAMDMMAMSPQNMASGASDAAWNSQADQRNPVAEPNFLEKAGSGIKDYFGSEENMANLAIGLNSMRLNPDANLAALMGKKLERLEKTKGNNKTAEALRQMGRVDLADLVEKGVMDGKTAYSLAFKPPSALQEKIDLYTKDPEAWKTLKEAGVVGSSGTTVNVGGEKMTPGWKKIDESFADEYVKWIGGTGADTAGNIAKLQDVLGKLESGEKLTGPIMGQLPDFLMAFLDPDAVGSREAVEGVVQRNLKAVLGAQFTEKEGEKLIKRAYNPTLDGKENARRLRVLVKQMNSALQSKNQMTTYFRENGTLMGYNGRVPLLNDFWAALEGLKVGQRVGNKTYLGGDPKLESSFK